MRAHYLLSITVIAAFSQTFTTTLPNNNFNFGMMGGAFGEAIRLTALVPPTSGDISATPCVVALGFADSVGTPLRRPVSMNLLPGQSAFTELDFSSMVTGLGQRFELRPVVTPAFTGSDAGCLISAEIFDRITGRTSSYARPFIDDPNITPPDTNFAAIGGATGQVMRLNLVAVSPGPCRAILGFAKSDGTAVGSSLRANLAVGQAVFLDLPMSLFPLTFGQRVEIRPVVHADVLNGASWCAASAVVYDQFSGRNETYVLTPRREGKSPQ